MSRIGRVLLNISNLRRVPVDPTEVYCLEAVGGDTLVRLRSKRRLRDVRPLGTLLREFGTGSSESIATMRSTWPASKRSAAGREGKGREDWEVKLEPPVNRVLPVSRGQVGKLLKAFGAGE